MTRKILGNDAKVNGTYKAQVAIDCAGHLGAAGLIHADQFTGDGAQRAAYLSTRGCGPVTWHYFGMLQGRSDTKPDTWIVRYVSKATATPTKPEHARLLVNAAATTLNVDPARLDHAIWLYAKSH